MASPLLPTPPLPSPHSERVFLDTSLQHVPDSSGKSGVISKCQNVSSGFLNEWKTKQRKPPWELPGHPFLLDVTSLFAGP